LAYFIQYLIYLLIIILTTILETVGAGFDAILYPFKGVGFFLEQILKKIENSNYFTLNQCHSQVVLNKKTK
jgi:hypothetical protein